MDQSNPGSGLLSFIPKPQLDEAAGDKMICGSLIRPVEPIRVVESFLLRYTKMAPWDLNGVCLKRFRP